MAENKNLSTNNYKLENDNNELVAKVKRIQREKKDLIANYQKFIIEINQLKKTRYKSGKMNSEDSILFIGKYDINLKSLEEQIINLNRNSNLFSLKNAKNSMPDVLNYKIQGCKCDAWILLGNVKPTMLLKNLITKVSIIIFVINLEKHETLDFLNEGWGPIIAKIDQNELNGQIRFLVGTGHNHKVDDLRLYSNIKVMIEKFKCFEYFVENSSRNLIKVTEKITINYNLIDILKLLINMDDQKEEDE